MNPSLPMAEVVVVGNGSIVEVGTMETVRPWLDAHPYTVDDSLRDKVLLPGFIDPHLHPSLAATLLPMEFVTAMEWQLPNRIAPAIKTPEGFLAELRRLERLAPGAIEPLLTWGYHDLWHGPMHRELLDGVSSERPVVVWQRSFHELFLNRAAMAHFGLDGERLAAHPQVDLDAGRFYETGMVTAIGAMAPYLLDPDRFLHGLELTKAAVHQGGQTTIGDLTGTQFDSDTEWAALRSVLDADDTPFRVQMIPVGTRALADEIGREDPAQWLANWGAKGSGKLFFRNHVKLFTDGGFFAQLMRVLEPGFIDGHQGEWLGTPEQFESLARAFWNAGCQIHVHCTGDMGLQLALDVLAKLQWERPRFDHRFTIEHLGLSNPEQIRQMAALGAIASVNVYYVHELGEAYWAHSVGHERASQMARMGTLVNNRIPTALHSDFTMAPAKPLTSAWVAVNRLGETGTVLGPEERISVDQAMRAITVDAAYALGMEHEIGSIRAGKLADFTVLDEDPYLVDPIDLKDIGVWGTVFEGEVFPA